jgi:hypothetical protein
VIEDYLSQLGDDYFSSWTYSEEDSKFWNLK